MISKTNSIKNFWTIFFGVVAFLSIAVAVTVSVIASNTVSRMRMSVIDDENNYKISQENTYRQSLYLACDSMKNIDADLGKIAVSNDRANQTKMLSNVIIHANMVNQSLSSLPFADSDNLSSVNKFVNQTQDYATYLLGELANGKVLDASERTALCNLDFVANNVYGFLQEYAESDSGMFMTNGNGADNVGSLSDGLGSVDSNAFSYEKLIYDGPFSDSVENKTLPSKGKINAESGGRIVSEIFGENKFVQQMNSKGLTYVYETKDGRVILSADGDVVQYEAYRESDEETSADCKVCIANAEEFCKKIGYDVKGVWISKTQDYVTYVNCATVTDGVIVYPELIKVAVDSKGEVVGLEARAYVINREENRSVNFGEVDEQTARKSVSGGLTITNVAKALIEKNNKTFLCYEFECKQGDRQYYVYVDSNSGNEVEIFKVIQNTEGFTVM